MSFVTRSCISPNNRIQVGSSCSLQLSKSPYVLHSHIVAARKFVFQHLLTRHRLARWFCNFAQFDPRGPAVGTKFRFGGDYAIAATEPPGWPCDILSGEVLRSVSFRWPLFGADTRVDWRAEDGSEGSVFP